MPSHLNTIDSPKRRPGFVLIAVLVIIFVLSLTAYSFTFMMINEDQATRLAGRQIQARYLAESGMAHTQILLSNNVDTIRELGGLWENENQFRAKVVSIDPDQPDRIGRFTVIASNLNEDGFSEGFRYGLTDESSKLNLNILPFADSWMEGGGRTLLMALPNMTESTADAIIDWLDSDDEIRDFGAEYTYYASTNPPYAPKNGPMDSIEELLLIRGVTPQLLFGLDNNHNGVLDPEERYSANASAIPDELKLGWANFVTLHSKENNLNPAGLQRININEEDLEQLYDDLRSVFNESWSTFIISYRQNGPYVSTDDDEYEDAPLFVPVDPSTAASFTYQQVLDLIDAETTAEIVDDEGTTQTVVLKSPIQSGNLQQTMPILMANVTTMQGDSIPGRINLMQAPRPVLAGIPGMTDEILARIIQLREHELDDPNLTDANRAYETWILVENVVDLPTMKMMFPFVCTGGDVYRAEIVGYFPDQVATSRAEVLFDTIEAVPRVLFWRDKSHLPSGYSVETLGVGF